MKPTYDISSLFLLPLIFCLSLPPHLAVADLLTSASKAAAPASGSLVGEACQFSMIKDLCVRSPQSLKESLSEDIISMVQVALKQASSTSADISERIDTILHNETSLASLTPGTDQCLAYCLEHFVDATDQLDDSMAALVTTGYKDVKAAVQAAVSDAESCEAGFKDQPSADKSVLGGSTEVFRELCSNALAIAQKLAH